MAIVSADSPIELPHPDPYLTRDVPDPGLSGDKGLDSLRHRQALAVCVDQNQNWRLFYRDVQKRFNTSKQ